MIQIVLNLWIQSNIILKHTHRAFPAGAVVKNPPANAGDVGSIPGPGTSHMPRATKPVHHNYCSRALEPQLLSPRATTTEAHAPRDGAPQHEKPRQ